MPPNAAGISPVNWLSLSFRYDSRDSPESSPGMEPPRFLLERFTCVTRYSSSSPWSIRVTPSQAMMSVSLLQFKVVEPLRMSPEASRISQSATRSSREELDGVAVLPWQLTSSLTMVRVTGSGLITASPAATPESVIRLSAECLPLSTAVMVTAPLLWVAPAGMVSVFSLSV